MTEAKPKAAATPEVPAPYDRFDLAPILAERGPGAFDREGRERDHIYASELGDCIRAAWFAFREPYRSDDDFSAHRGALGHAVEDLMAEKLAPIIVRGADGREGREVSFHTDRVSGRVDFVVRFRPDRPQLPIELKTTYAFDKSLALPYKSHVAQLQWYLSQMGHSPYGLLMYYNLSNWGNRAGYWECLKIPRDDEGIARRIDKMWKALHQPVEPSCEFPEEDGGLCFKCGLRVEANRARLA